MATEAELYEENIRLRSILGKCGELKTESDSPGQSSQVITEDLRLMRALLGRRNIKLCVDDTENTDIVRHYSRRSTWRCMKMVLCFLMFMSLVTVIGFVSWLGFRSKSMQSIADVTGELLPEAKAQQQVMKEALGVALPKDIDLNVGLRQDFRLQDCNDNTLKLSFPDIDYSFLGYNILRGFPLATGHDPGFTYPIFVADYTSHLQTADCRYSVPEGLVVIPDVSCMTSFSSKTVQSTNEFSKELSVSADVKGGGWGLSFSASAGYKESSAELSSGESVFIISSAECNYYFSKLMVNNPPKFHKVFLDWIIKLNSSIEQNKNMVFLEFLDRYGTHFATEVTYGARYTYQHKMGTDTFRKETSKGVNVATQAGYSGIIRVGGGFGLDASQRKAASDFQKNVETKTFTVGAAPPANGDAITWASEVKSTPVPTKYVLVMISDLFTEQYMGGLGVDFKSIQTTLQEMIPAYCLFLKRKGEVESCAALNAGITLRNSRLYNHYRSVDVDSENLCIDRCMEIISCDAVGFSPTYNHIHKCFLYSESTLTMFAREEGRQPIEDKWQSTLFLQKIEHEFRLANTSIDGMERSFELNGEKRVSNILCWTLCANDEFCVAFSYCSNCPDKITNCLLYSKTSIYGVKEDPEYFTVFIGKAGKTANPTRRTTVHPILFTTTINWFLPP